MRARQLLVGVAVGALVSAGLIHAQVASAATACPPNPAPGSTFYSIQVPAGLTCTLDNITVSLDVLVNAGATLITKNGTAIGRNLTANGAKQLTLSGGKIDGALKVNGTDGTGHTSNVCGVAIGGAVTITQIGNGDEVDFGDDRNNNPCPGNTVGGAVNASNNGSSTVEAELEIDGNNIGAGLTANNNVAAMDIAGNTIGANFRCSGGTNSDGDPNIPKNDEAKNTVGGTRFCFPTPHL